MVAADLTPSILLADDNPACRRLWRRALSGCGCRFQEAGTTSKTLECIASGMPRVILLDLFLDDDPAGPNLCRTVSDAAPPGALIDILAISGMLEGEGHLQTLLESGASWYLDKCEHPAALRRTVNDILRPAVPAKLSGAGRDGPRVLMVDDDDGFLRALAGHFEAQGFIPYCASCAQEAFLSLAKVRPHAVVLDHGLPDMCGMEVAAILKARRSTAHLPSLLMAAEETPRLESTRFKFEADDRIIKRSHDPADLPLRVKRLLERSAALGADVLEAGPIRAELSTKTAYVEGSPIPLSETEFKLLVSCMRKSPRIVTWLEIHDEVWGRTPARFLAKATHVVESTLNHLKAKLGGKAAALIRTHRGIGLSLRNE